MDGVVFPLWLLLVYLFPCCCVTYVVSRVERARYWFPLSSPMLFFVNSRDLEPLECASVFVILYLFFGLILYLPIQKKKYPPCRILIGFVFWV